MPARSAWGHGLATITDDGAVLDAWYPAPVLGLPAGTPVPAGLTAAVRTDPARGVRVEVVTTLIDLDTAPVDVPDAYLRLHLLSHRLVAPGEQNLDGLLTMLPTVVWTDAGPCTTDGFEATRARLRAAHGRPVTVHGIDRLPRMTDYVIPSGVRVVDAARVRLGAYLAEGTTVTPEGFVGHDAGTLGASRVGGHVSTGVVVGEGTDIGCGASVSPCGEPQAGSGAQVVSLGRRCLLGAGSGLGIPLGDDCMVEAGLHVMASTEVRMIGFGGHDGDLVVARDLAMSEGMAFRRGPSTGAVEAVARAEVGTSPGSAPHSPG
ncbi:MAG: 2,3,4,5-tetrahydropyridine-2,6-dicarboxylate N-succinyltransferase [Micrococcales bacterium]|nr:2,3,4,5-tetrahydropyridine-2,6-dicarboxylate N-succinyltransferase [Micrococcales bacterium]